VSDGPRSSIRAGAARPDGRGRAARTIAAAAGGAVAVLMVMLAIGLPSAPSGAADNGDGARLFCGAGLTPLTPDGRSNWKGGVVLDFATGPVTCADPIVSSALPILRLATTGSGTTWSLARLGVLYALAVGGFTALAVFAIGPTRRLVVLVPALAPLAGPMFSRFFVSTFSEPAGLLGMCALCLGAGVVGVTGRDDRAARIIGTLLTAGGGLLAATAKASFLPLLPIAAVLCGATVIRLGARPGRRDRLAGLATSAGLIVLAAPLVLASLHWQQRHVAAVNAHNLVFTAVLPDVGTTALDPLGLPAAALNHSGRAYYPDGPAGVPGASVIAGDPDRTRAAAYRVLITHPSAAAGELQRGMAATLGAALTYLPSEPLAPSSVAPELGATVGEQGADRAQLQAWLDGLSHPWLPSLVAVTGLTLGVLTRHRGGVVVRALSRVAALAAACAVALVATAVAGDGFFEIAKHVWPAAYLLQVAAAAAVLTGIAAARSAILRRGGSAPSGSG
jgi:hypothetical protein